MSPCPQTEVCEDCAASRGEAGHRRQGHEYAGQRSRTAL